MPRVYEYRWKPLSQNKQEVNAIKRPASQSDLSSTSYFENLSAKDVRTAKPKLATLVQMSRS